MAMVHCIDLVFVKVFNVTFRKFLCLLTGACPRKLSLEIEKQKKKRLSDFGPPLLRIPGHAPDLLFATVSLINISHYYYFCYTFQYATILIIVTLAELSASVLTLLYKIKVCRAQYMYVVCTQIKFPVVWLVMADNIYMYNVLCD